MRTLGKLELAGPGGEPIDFRRLLASHGVADLAPNDIDSDNSVLETTVEAGDHAHTLRITEADGSLRVQAESQIGDRETRRELLSTARRVLALDQDLSPFYSLAAKDPALSWVTAGAGRMLRAPTVFEDVVKTICTTNCSWSATIRMTDALVTELGMPAFDGRHAFPSPRAMAEAPADFYEQTARAGYRGAYLRRLATDVAEERLDLEALTDPELSDADVEQRLLALPGVGPYAAAHVMLMSLGRYGQLILDSWTRPKYSRLNGRAATDEQIRRRFRRYGEYAGLAFWMRLTRDWVED